MTLDCSIVIRAYNEEKQIGRLLTGIMQQSIKDTQIILVDSGSTDKTVDIASQFSAEILHIDPQAFTFGHSLNIGIAAAKARLVVITSAHVYPVYPDWLEHLLLPFKNERVALTYGKQRGGDLTKFSEHRIFAHWFSENSMEHQGHPFCNNANAAIRQYLWETHPYNEGLPALEDLDWARWVHEQGYSIAYAAEAEIIHVHNETWENVYNRYRREGMAFKQIYPHETFTAKDLIYLFVNNVVNDLSAARRKKIFGNVWGSIFRFRWMQFWGTYCGYHQSGPLTNQLKQTFYYPQTRVSPSHKSNRPVHPIQYHE